MKTAVLLVCMITTLSSVQLPNQVNQVSQVSQVQLQSSNDLIMPCADVIKRIYRMSHGILQYRSWNETWGYWVEPDWINISS